MVFAEAFNLYSKCYICGWLHPYMSNRSQDMKCVLRNKCHGSHFYEPLSLFTSYSIEKHSYLSTNSIVNWKTFLSQSIDTTCALCFSFLIFFRNSSKLALLVSFLFHLSSLSSSCRMLNSAFSTIVQRWESQGAARHSRSHQEKTQENIFSTTHTL